MRVTFIEKVVEETIILLPTVTDLLAELEITLVLEELATPWSNDESYVRRLLTFRRGCIMAA